MNKSISKSNEAVVFYEDGALGKQMLLTELDAVLDGVVPMFEFADQSLEAAFVRLDGKLVITAAVFFRISFDSRGYPVEGWNVPLYHLADAAERGPDMGAGPVRVACLSQCPVPGCEGDLWDPQLGIVSQALRELQELLKNNRLGFDVDDVATQAAPAWAAGPAATGAPQASGGEFMQATMDQHSRQLGVLRDQHAAELKAYAEQLAKLQGHLKVLQNEKHELLAQLQEHGNAIAAKQADVDEELATLRRNAAERESSIRADAERREEQLLAEAEQQKQALIAERDEVIRATVAERIAELERHLAVQEQRRDQQEEQLNSLRAELTDLRRSKLRLLEGGADEFLEKLRDKGIKFVVFAPGAGHVNIALEEMVTYMEDTESFVAKRCGVSVEHYRAWLAHYNKPSCQGHASRETLCGKPVQKCLRPGEFVVGLHDRCDIHRRGELPGAGGASARSS